VNVRKVGEITGLSQPAANALTNALEKEGLLTKITGKKTYRVFRFEANLGLFSERRIEARAPPAVNERLLV
jgi:DNA-binding IclR family transcriptional regulator